jgi:hypothetical protein
VSLCTLLSGRGFAMSPWGYALDPDRGGWFSGLDIDSGLLNLALVLHPAVGAHQLE